MKAGREIDALVAEKVMGLMLICPVDPRWDHSVGTNRDGSSAKRNFCRWPDGREHWIPFFSTDIADAWQVVEKLREKWAVELHSREGVWNCLVEEGDEVTAHYIATEEADTAPLAICLAALKAVGVEVDSPK